ncbi:MAG: glycosyltransferase family 4 protein [Desulfohalobiaceae bacterium]|nr:glycosyltransferase family 4 protein [Desulfohalobiaceae bacterium]
MYYLLNFLGVALASFLLTGLLRRYALSRRLLDIPNERSSHSIPTPRGGGPGLVLPFLAGMTGLVLAGAMPAPLFWALLGAGGWTALIGWLDDRGSIPIHLRLIGHFLAAGGALAWLGGLPTLPVFGLEMDLGLAGHLLAAVYLVWLLNLYNFMDGIDGIAGIEAVTVCLGAAVLSVFSGPDTGLWILSLPLAAAAAGFLFWNFPRARIFMGDAGSGFIGMVLGVLSLQAAWTLPELFWSWVILMGAFVVDATVTLLKRAWHRERFYQAHSSHAYQHAARRYGSHAAVSLAFGAINLFWLLPMAVLVSSGLVDGVLGVIIAYAPLVWAAHHFKAGAEGYMNREYKAKPEILEQGK